MCSTSLATTGAVRWRRGRADDGIAGAHAQRGAPTAGRCRPRPVRRAGLRGDDGRADRGRDGPVPAQLPPLFREQGGRARAVVRGGGRAAGGGPDGATARGATVV